MIKWLIAFWFRNKGWRFAGALPKRLNKCIIVAAPHTSKQDFFLGVAVSHIIRFRTHFMINKKHFKVWNRALLNHVDAKPYEPTNAEELIRTLVNSFNERRKFSAVLCPQEYDSNGSDWNEAYLEIAHKSDTPIVMVALDYKKKEVKFHSHFSAGTDRERDVEFMKKWFSSFHGKHPNRRVERPS